MADGKWINGLSPQMLVSEAARITLPSRLRIVLHHLPLAIDAAAKDVEHVHQLRVATRRAGAALRLFRECLSDKQYRKLRNLLRALRRAAGAARDWDVFYEHIRQSSFLAHPDAQPALDFLTGFTAAQRLRAQNELIEIAPRENEKLTKMAADLTDLADAWEKLRREQSFGELAAHQTKALIEEMHSQAALAPKTYSELHQLRIHGKRLRYSMEIFADCFTSPFREELYPALEQIQEILGCITDAHVAVERLSAIRDHMKAFHRDEWTRVRKPMEQLLQAQRRIFPRERKRFLVWWPRWVKLTSEMPLLAI